MECKFLKVRSGQRLSAVCVASLLIAANDFGYSTPLEVQRPIEQILCIDAGETDFPQIQFAKGQVQHKSGSGNEYRARSIQPSNGDTLTTGQDGFVSILLTDGSQANVQPHSLVKFDSSMECDSSNADTDSAVHLETPYLSAAIRG